MAEKIKTENQKHPHSTKTQHWFNHIFYGLAIFCALWRHGDPIFTTAVLAAIPPLILLIYVPEKYLPIDIKELCQIPLLGGALLWGTYRFTLHIPLDKVLIESICLVGLSFSFSDRQNHYQYQLLIGVVLILYGSIFPRTIFVYTLPIAFLLGLILLYISRTVGLARDIDVGIPGAIFTKNWYYLLLHLVLTILIGAYLYSVFPSPSPDNPRYGLLVSSFGNKNESYLPPEYNSWFKSRFQRRSYKGTVIRPGRRRSMFKSKLGPPLPSKKKTKIKGISASGNGAAPPGNELVFKVKSPLKLYWLGQLYDHYDGTLWTASKKMKKQKIKFNSSMLWKNIKYVRQVFIVEKWISRVLCSAYMASSYSFSNFGFKAVHTFYNEKIPDYTPYPDTPFTYTVSSTINWVGDSREKQEKADSGFWNESLKPQHYLQLPTTRISSRLQELAADITRKAESPYDKAIALRDYLRNNFKYKLLAKPVPKGKEAVDYFLFKLKEGHCQYYATVLTVLARLNGLPARLATGFSPGNYNVLNNYFEVHEYHAHAWTQIFIKKMGWLTFDGTPPGQIISRPKPFALGDLHDPFDDEWKIVPPELTKITQKFAKPITNILKNRIKLQNPNSSLAKLSKLIMSIPMSEEELDMALAKIENKEEIKTKGKKKGRRKIKIKFERDTVTNRLKNALKRGVKGMLAKITMRWQQFLDWLLGMNGAAILLCAAIVILLRLCYPMVRDFFNRTFKLKKCLKMYGAATESVTSDPAKCIDLCYHVIRGMLDLAGQPREHNMELFDYGATLASLDKTVCKDSLVVFFLYTQFEYSILQPTHEDSTQTLERTEKVKNIILENFI